MTTIGWVIFGFVGIVVWFLLRRSPLERHLATTPPTPGELKRRAVKVVRERMISNPDALLDDEDLTLLLSISAKDQSYESGWQSFTEALLKQGMPRVRAYLKEIATTVIDAVAAERIVMALAADSAPESRKLLEEIITSFSRIHPNVFERQKAQWICRVLAMQDSDLVNLAYFNRGVFSDANEVGETLAENHLPIARELLVRHAFHEGNSHYLGGLVRDRLSGDDRSAFAELVVPYMSVREWSRADLAPFHMAIRALDINGQTLRQLASGEKDAAPRFVAAAIRRFTRSEDTASTLGELLTLWDEKYRSAPQGSWERVHASSVIFLYRYAEEFATHRDEVLRIGLIALTEAEKEFPPFDVLRILFRHRRELVDVASVLTVDRWRCVLRLNAGQSAHWIRNIHTKRGFNSGAELLEGIKSSLITVFPLDLIDELSEELLRGGGTLGAILVGRGLERERMLGIPGTLHEKYLTLVERSFATAR